MMAAGRSLDQVASQLDSLYAQFHQLCGALMTLDGPSWMCKNAMCETAPVPHPAFPDCPRVTPRPCRLCGRG